MNEESEVARYRVGSLQRAQERLVGPDPGHAGQTAEVEGRELAERSGGEVQVGERAPSAAVGDRDRHRLALVWEANAFSDGSTSGRTCYSQVAVTLRPQIGLALGLAPL